MNKKSKKVKIYNYKGGNKMSLIKPEPYQEYGLPKGATNYREAAFLQQQQMSEYQNNLNNIHGGSNNTNNKIIVPSFPDSGEDISPLNANTASQLNNSTHIQSKVNATNDHWAYNPEIISKGGKKNRKRGLKNKRKSKSNKSKSNKSKSYKKTKRRIHTRKNKYNTKKQKGGYLNWYEAFPNLYNERNTG